MKKVKPKKAKKKDNMVIPEFSFREVKNSSIIASLGYQLSKKTLFIAFHKGTIYAYPNMEWADYQELAKADSVGSHFRKFYSEMAHKKVWPEDEEPKTQ